MCLPTPVLKDIFAITYDENGHLGFAKVYERIINSFYICNLTEKLKDYLKHCLQCQINQTRRHKPYGSLQPILSPPIPFHTLTIDFILALPQSILGLDCLMSVTCKFSKRVSLIPGKNTWSAGEWSSALLERLEIADWGLPKVIISDRDKKFLSQLWEGLFCKLGVKLLYFTAYHPQTDGQSERTNQTVEIAFRFLLATLENPADWPTCVSSFQSMVNNSQAASTNKTPNKVVYGFTPLRATDLISKGAETTGHKVMPAKIAHSEAADAIAFAQLTAKKAYDRKHQPIQMTVGDYALIRLHKGYHIPSTVVLGPKLSQQYTGPFCVLERIGNLAYCLELPQHWRVHPVFTIAQLEPCPTPGQDLFKRHHPTHPDPIFVDGDNDNVKSFEVDKIIAHRNTKRRGTEYLVRWLGYGPEHDDWRNLRELGDAMEVLKDYQTRTGITAIEETPKAPLLTDRTTQPVRKLRGRPRKDANLQGPPEPALSQHKPRGRPRKPVKNIPITETISPVRRTRERLQRLSQ